MSVILGGKVRSKRTGRTYTVATFSDRFKNIDINYVKDFREDFEVVEWVRN